MSNITHLLEIMSRLRDPQHGCPWDQQQTYQSIVPHTLEEAYEVAETIEQQDYSALVDELGDLLFQIVFYAQLGREEQRFDFDDVVAAICEKLIRRHPHVFADRHIANAEQQTHHWEELKKQERLAKGVAGNSPVSELDGINRALPALSLAAKLQSRAARSGFDWPDEQGVFAKLQEEIQELQAAWSDPVARQEEMGDLLFTCVNLCRHAQLDAEQSLRMANRKFEQRFRSMEVRADEQGHCLKDLSTAQLEEYWQAVK